MLFSKIIEKKFDAVLGRYDGTDAYYYFSPADFPDIKAEPFDIENSDNISLKGSFYYYGEMSNDRLLVFDHGIGAGHLAYFKEIEYLAKNGYTVYSYDHTGCVSSGGKGIKGFAQGINDLNCVLNTLKKDSRFENAEFLLVGHSWGAYSAMNAGSLHPEVTHIVSLAGFLSARSLIEQYIPNLFLRYSEEVMERERKHNPDFADMDARNSLKNTSAKFLHIQSEDDLKVKFNLSFTLLEAALKDRKDTAFIRMQNRNHEPHHTDKAVKACEEMTSDFEKLYKKHKLSNKDEMAVFRNNYDWNIITEQDPEIWDKILNFLKS